MNELSAKPDIVGRHPVGLSTLFFTEMWERFSYYGMRALLVLFMVDTIEHGGMGLSDEVATAIYGLYTAFVYLSSLPGGWIADRLLGAQRSVWYGGLLIAAGHFTLAVPADPCFYGGLMLIVLGTGLLKPNISVIVGHLYPPGDGRRDAGFTIFYMGINLGAFIGPLVCSGLGENLSWHWGFAAAGVGMLLGLTHFKRKCGQLGDAGLYPARQAVRTAGIERGWLWVIAGVTVVLAIFGAGLSGTLNFNPIWLAQRSTYAIAGIGAAFLGHIFLFGRLTKIEAQRVGLLVLLLFAAALFWAGFEQAGSSLNLFAERNTHRVLAWRKLEIPAGWFQSLNAVFILILSPVVAAVWENLSRRGRSPSILTKLAFGLIFLGVGFLVMFAGSNGIRATQRTWPTWLIGTYFLHTIGELCLSPVGLSAVTKLAPQRFVGQMMGLWFLSTAFGNLLASLFASEIVSDVSQMPASFLRLTAIAVVSGAILLVIARMVGRGIQEDAAE